MLLENKTGLIFGVANQRSIAWGIARALAGAGARLAFTYHHRRHQSRLQGLVDSLPGAVMLPCDATKEEEVTEACAQVAREFGQLDFIVHSIAYAPRESLTGKYMATSRAAFLTTVEISVYSLVVLARAAAALMSEGGSIVSLTYYGAEKVIRNYNVMGVAKAALEASTRYLAADLGTQKIRVNAISAGPVMTLAARGVADMVEMLKQHAARAPLSRNVTLSEIGKAALFLCSSLSSGITGEVLHVDCGYNIMGA